MKIRTKLTLLFALIFSALILLLNLFIYYSYADMRKDEFYLRLEAKSNNTLRLLADVDDIDHALLRVVDKNTINAMYEEKTLVFNADKKLLYSSLDNHPVNYSAELLDEIMEKGEVYFTDPDTKSEVLGQYSIFGPGRSYIVLSTAYDRYGIEKLEDMRNTLLIASFIGITLAVLLGYWLIYKGFSPLEVLNKNIRSITEQNLNIQVHVKKGAKDEFSELAESYNQMLLRLYDAFDRQKTFVHHASHELRTPVSVMMSEVEIALKGEEENSDRHNMLTEMRNSLDKISDLINSLLLLSKIQDMADRRFQTERVDEIVFAAAETVSERMPQFKPVIHFAEVELSDENLQVPCHKYLIKILLGNLMENGSKYSDDGRVEITIHPDPEFVTVEFVNGGPTISAADQKKLFTPFFRSANASGKPGHGLGLSVCERIATYHGAELKYAIKNGMNCFSIKLRRS